MLLSLFFWILPLGAESLTLDLGKSGGMTGQMVQLFLLVSVLSLAPSLVMMVTSFTRFAIVFSFLRNAIGTQQSPPNPVIMSLALFLTLFVMMPTFEKAYNDGVKPLIEEKIPEVEAIEKIARPFHDFMMRNVKNKELSLFLNLAKIPPPTEASKMPFRVLIPAFMASELKRAFEIGFLIYIPFLVIDILVACILMAMGMMMIPPMMISMPFKLIFFVFVDGWALLCGSLVQSFL